MKSVPSHLGLRSPVSSVSIAFSHMNIVVCCSFHRPSRVYALMNCVCRWFSLLLVDLVLHVVGFIAGLLLAHSL